MTEREQFEEWMSGEGEWPNAVQRNGYPYALAQTQTAWLVWEAAMRASRINPDQYLCIKPACGNECYACRCAISPQEMRDYAIRYAIIRNAPLNAIKDGGVFAGKTPENLVINGEDLDAAIDAVRPPTIGTI